MKKPKTTTVKPVPKAKQSVAAKSTQEKPETTPPKPKSPNKVTVKATKSVIAPPEMAMSDRVGLTAGSIWNYLNENGATAIAKMVKELPEEEKIIQRSIGWLAQEGKITLETTGRVESIALKS